MKFTISKTEGVLDGTFETLVGQTNIRDLYENIIRRFYTSNLLSYSNERPGIMFT